MLTTMVSSGDNRKGSWSILLLAVYSGNVSLLSIWHGPPDEELGFFTAYASKRVDWNIFDKAVRFKQFYGLAWE